MRHTPIRLENPIQHFNNEDLLESLLINSIYSESENYIKIEATVVNWSLDQGVREFRQYLFRDAHRFARLNLHAQFPELGRNEYQTSKHMGSYVIQDVSIFKEGNYFHLDLNLGSPFGTIAFHFSDAWVLSRLGRGEPIDEGWKYYDCEDGEEFDFYNPFGNASESTNQKKTSQKT